MKIVCVADAYVNEQMMEDGIKPFIKEDDTYKILFFGEKSRIEMRDIVKLIEAKRLNEIKIPQELYFEIEDADILIVHLCPVMSDLLSKANKLKAILSCRGGIENIDVEIANSRNIIVTTNPAHNANAVAEYTIGLMLCETRNIVRADESLRKNIWRENFPNTITNIRELRDLTIGIIGFGSVGRLVAQKLKAFDCNILINDPYLNESAYDFINFKVVDLETLLRESDIVTIHARSNKAIISNKEFEMMKATSYLINTARSSCVDQTALKDAIKNKKIMGAAIDVFETEPIIPDFYKEFDNITITNHRGGDTINSYQDSPRFALSNYIKFLNGERLLFWVNKNEIEI